MSKTLISPVKRYPGSITLPDYLTFPQVNAWEEAMQAANTEAEDATKALPHAWKAAREIVSEWNLEGIDPAKPPATPRIAAVELATWIIGAINALFRDEEIDPKA